MQERSLIRRLKQHQPQALEELITTYSPYVGTIIRNIIGKYLAEPDVEELTADVFLAVWEHTDQLKAGKLTAYLAAIARNRAKNRIRSYHETVNLEDLVEIGSEEDVEGSIDQKIHRPEDSGGTAAGRTGHPLRKGQGDSGAVLLLL